MGLTGVSVRWSLATRSGGRREKILGSSRKVGADALQCEGMNAWSRPHLLLRHGLQSSFDALGSVDAARVADWVVRSGLREVLLDGVGPPRDLVVGALGALARDPGALRPGRSTGWIDRRVETWSTVLAERLQAGLAPPCVLSWWLERLRLHVEGDLRRGLAREVVAQLRRSAQGQGLPEPDRLAVDAALARVSIELVDSAERFRAAPGEEAQRLKPWVLGIARNVARENGRVERTRSGGRGLAALELEGCAAPEDHSIEWRDERAWLIAQVSSGRAAPFEAAVAAHLIDGESDVGWLAARLGLRPERVYKRRVDLRQRLRIALRGRGFVE